MEITIKYMQVSHMICIMMTTTQFMRCTVYQLLITISTMGTCQLSMKSTQILCSITVMITTATIMGTIVNLNTGLIHMLHITINSSSIMRWNIHTIALIIMLNKLSQLLPPLLLLLKIRA